MSLKLYDSYTRKKKTFKPVKAGSVGIYACGQTVYSSAHIGHGTVYVKWDILRQYLKHWKGLKVKYVQNITDFGHMTQEGTDSGEDKVKKASKKEHKSVKEIAKFYTKDFYDSMDALCVERPDLDPKATDHINEMIKLIQEIVRKGYGYECKGSVYFDTCKLGPRYGKLSGMIVKNMKCGARVGVCADKKNPTDFVLWAKNRSGHAQAWDSPWGKGMPGWHIECNAMNRKYLGVVFDIHTGGIDHYFPHHENEIAQALGSTGKVPANFWVHAGVLTIGNEKMAKSLGNFVTIKDMLKDVTAEEFRMWVLSSHYKSPMEYSAECIKQSDAKVERINWFIQQLLAVEKTGSETKCSKDLVSKCLKKFEAAMDDDINTPLALEAVFSMIRDANKELCEDKFTKKDADAIIALLKKIDKVFKVMGFEKKKATAPAEINALIKEREILRAQAKWKDADNIRSESLKKGYELMDTPDGTKWRKK